MIQKLIRNIVKFSMVGIFFVLPCNISYGNEFTDGFMSNTAKMFQVLNYKLDKDSFLKNVEQMNFSQHLAGPQELASQIIALIRNQGVFMQCFKIKKTDLVNVPTPFFAYRTGEGYYLVTDIIQTSDEIVTYNAKGNKVVFEIDGFIENWNEYVLSQPIMNLLVENGSSQEISNGPTIHFIYSLHEEDFSRIKPILEKIIQKCKKKNKNLIYIDELGLIPYKTINQAASSNNISEREAFTKIKRQLSDQVSNLGKGITIYDSNLLYRKLYAYFAKNKIKSVMEDLNYELWLKIVEFDDKKLNSSILASLISGNTDQALNLIATYQAGFGAYNIYMRDVMFSYQVMKLAADNPNTDIVILRGLGHYGLEEYTNLIKGYKVKTVVVGAAKFKDNLVDRDYIYSLVVNGVAISKSKKELYFLRSIPQEILRLYFYKKKVGIKAAIRYSNSMLEHMDREAINKYFKFIFDSIWMNPEFKKEKFSEKVLEKYTYKWFKEQMPIAEQDFEVLQE